jgi:hypothetical protein
LIKFFKIHTKRRKNTTANVDSVKQNQFDDDVVDAAAALRCGLASRVSAAVLQRLPHLFGRVRYWIGCRNCFCVCVMMNDARDDGDCDCDDEDDDCEHDGCCCGDRDSLGDVDGIPRAASLLFYSD